MFDIAANVTGRRGDAQHGVHSAVGPIHRAYLGVHSRHIVVYCIKNIKLKYILYVIK